MLHVALNAHLLSGEASYRSAGIHGYLYHTLAHIPEIDPDISYTVFVGRGQLPPHHNWRIWRSSLPTQKPLARILWEQVIAPVELRRIRPDLLHGMAFALPMLWNRPSVVTIFDLSFVRYPERLGRARRLYLQWATQLAAKRARRVIAISESGKAEIQALLGVPEARIDVAVPGVSERFMRLPPEAVAAFRVRRNLPDRFILYLGTLEPRKNLATLLRAYAALPHRSEVKLVLAGGKGWQTEQLFALIQQLDITTDVILPGYVPGEELPLWYNAAEIFVYPSVYEGFGLPLVEAMACGVPVVASDTTSLPEAVGPDGFLLRPLEVNTWSDSLAALLDNPRLRADFSERGLIRARLFNWRNTAQRIVETYHRALDSENTPAV